MKDTLTETKNNLQGINSGMDEAETMIWKIKKKKHSIRAARRKKDPKK